MALLEIRTFPDPVLREKCRDVTVFDESLRTLVQNMAETMYASDGVGLAAPQVGLPIRLAVIDTAPAEERGKAALVLVNPAIMEREGTMKWSEGCLSLPGVTVEVDRCQKVVVTAQDVEGRALRLEAADLLAVAIQHELDHLDGEVLFDRLNPLQKRLAIRDYSRARREARKEAEEREAE